MGTILYRPKRSAERNGATSSAGFANEARSTPRSVENEQGGYDATVLCAIAAPALPLSAPPPVNQFLDRCKCFAAPSKAGIEPDPRLCVDADPSEQSGHSAVAELLRRGVEFDAIFAASDVAAIGAMHALQNAGRTIPQEIAIVGFDDIPAASLSSPRLTTVDQDARRAGEALCRCVRRSG